MTDIPEDILEMASAAFDDVVTHRRKDAIVYVLLSERRKQIERDAKIAEEQAVHFLSPQYATGQPLSSIGERVACSIVATAIRAQQEPKP